MLSRLDAINSTIISLSPLCPHYTQWNCTPYNLAIITGPFGLRGKEGNQSKVEQIWSKISLFLTNSTLLSSTPPPSPLHPNGPYMNLIISSDLHHVICLNQSPKCLIVKSNSFFLVKQSSQTSFPNTIAFVTVNSPFITNNHLSS